MKSQSNFFNKSKFDDVSTDNHRGKTSHTRMPILMNNGGTLSNFFTYNIQNISTTDNDKLKDELLKIKLELNKKNKEHHALKIAYKKLDEENKRNIRVIEEILAQADKRLMENPEEEMGINNFSPLDIFRLKETHTSNSLKRQIAEYKSQLAQKDEKITQLMLSSKVVKCKDYENKLRFALDELEAMTMRYNTLKTSYLE